MSLPGSQNASEAECYHYGDLNDLQNVSVYLPRPLQDKEPQTGYWVMYANYRDLGLSASISSHHIELTSTQATYTEVHGETQKS